MRAVHVVGGGPAGVMAAFAAMREGAGVRIFEKSAFPRHKVCGEFLFACHPPSPPPRRLRGGFPSTPPGRPECDATPLWHACHPPSAARTRLRPQSLRTRPSPPRTFYIELANREESRDVRERENARSGRVDRESAFYCVNPTWIVTVAYTVTVPV